MSKQTVLDLTGKKVSDITLNASLWAIEPNDAVLYDALRLSRNAQRQGTHDTKTRDEVRGGGRKPWKQKGTGRARQGSTRAPHWRTGGVVFGPHPRSYATSMNRKERRLALKSALAYKAISNELVVIDSFNVETSKTKDMINILNNLGVNNKVTLIVVDELTENMILATRNISNIILQEASEINVLDIVAAHKMIVTKAAIKAIEEVLV